MKETEQADGRRNSQKQTKRLPVRIDHQIVPRHDGAAYRLGGWCLVWDILICGRTARIAALIDQRIAAALVNVDRGRGGVRRRLIVVGLQNALLDLVLGIVCFGRTLDVIECDRGAVVIVAATGLAGQ